jgi:hypothetical protein
MPSNSSNGSDSKDKSQMIRFGPLGGETAWGEDTTGIQIVGLTSNVVSHIKDNID